MENAPLPGWGGIGGGEEDFGNRADGTKKGTGFFGLLKRPDGAVSTELSVGVEIDGRETEIPLLVPSLSKDEIDFLLGGGEPTEEIMSKAFEFAVGRIKGGKSPFAGNGEQVPLPAAAVPQGGGTQDPDAAFKRGFDRIMKRR